MHLIQILLPLYANDGVPLERALFDQVAAELTQRFGGMTAYARSPASGLWKEEAQAPAQRDDLVVYEVMADTLDEAWWRQYRATLEQRFLQKAIVVRAHGIRML